MSPGGRPLSGRKSYQEFHMAYNVSGWGTVSANSTIAVGYRFGDPGNDAGAQFAQGKPEGARIDGSSNGSLVSFNHQINLDVANGGIVYVFQLQNLTDSDTSFMLCGGGLS
jgi:hypothetical protein